MRRVGVFGGTFDPIHVGHLVAALDVRFALDLDVVLLVVANDPWQKAGRDIAPAADRLAVVAAAVDGVDGLEASDLEIERGGPSFTADTLDELAAAEPDARRWLVVGADVVPHLHTWERHEDVRRAVRLALVNRPGAAGPRVPEGWAVDRVEIPAIDVSSTDVRSRLREGRPAGFLVPPAAMRVIQERGLYASPRMSEHPGPRTDA